jgi:hypothetical protein
VSDIPHDLSAFITYALLLAFVGFIVVGGRERSPAPRPPGPGGRGGDDSEP